MGVIIYNGVASNSKRFVAPILVEHLPNYKFAEYNYETEEVPGRSGDILINKGCYKNVERSYDLAIADEDVDFHILASQLVEWLIGENVWHQYVRLEDSYEPDYYRMAILKDAGEITNILGHAGRITVTFLCKPYRYLKSGDNTITINTSGQHITNPTLFRSYPKLKVYGSKSAGEQTLTINSIDIKFTEIDEWTTIDCENYGVWGPNGTNKNDTVILSSTFPWLNPNKYDHFYEDYRDEPYNTITFTSGITKVEVIPRWRTL